MRRYAYVFCTALFAGALCASQVCAAIVASGGSALPSSLQNKTSEVFLTLQNLGPYDDALIGAAASQTVQTYLAAPTTEIVNGAAAQRLVPIRDLTLPAGQAQTLSPSGARIVLMNMRQTLFPGEEFPVTLHFVRNPPITVMVTVVQPAAR